MKNNRFKIILTVWLSVGIFIGGYLMMYPPMHWYESEHYSDGSRTIAGNREGEDGKIILLCTLSGAILIYGIGTTKKEK